jgi:TPP-dependent indolepyruvate ferredoxin oxidoreductase alpha subunit
VVGVKQPQNLTIIVLDNGFFAETGMQPSHSGLGTDLAAVARGFGIPDTSVVDSMRRVPDVAAKINARDGVSYFHVLITTTHQKRSLPSRDGVTNKVRFRAALGIDTF